ncbi:MAG: hypothetical protein AAF483_19755 [Planctomycetota bacterium]
MRFSITFLILLTLWAALSMQTYRSYSRQRLAIEQKAEMLAQENAAANQITLLKIGEYESKSLMYQQDIEQIRKLQNAFETTFGDAIPALFEINPVADCVSVRTLPILERARISDSRTKVAIPESRKIAVRVALYEDYNLSGGWKSDEERRLNSVLELRGKHPVLHPLTPGIHEIHVTYNYQDQAKRPYFALRVDKQEVCRLTADGKGMRGTSTGRPNFFSQRNFPEDEKLPFLIDISPSGTDFEIRVELIEREL